MPMTLRALLVLSLLLLLAPAACPEDDYYTVWTRGGPTIEPSGLKDYGWAERGDRFLSTVEASSGRIQTINKFSKQGTVLKHTVATLNFTAPPAQLRVGDSFRMEVKGSIRRLDKAAPFAEASWVRVFSGNLRFDQRHKLCEATPDLAWTISGRVTGRPHDEFDVVASMDKGAVTWTYRAQRVPVRPEDRGGVVGIAQHVEGGVMVLAPSGGLWRPLVQGESIRVGSTLKTDRSGTLTVVWNRPAESGARGHLILGTETMMRVEDMARPDARGFGFLSGILRYVRRRVAGAHDAEVVRIQAGDVTFEPEGTDFLLMHQPAGGVVACYVGEGSVALRSPTGRARIDAGQQLITTRGRPGAAQAMRSGQWDALTRTLSVGPARPSPGPVPAPPRATSLRVEAVSVRFFESGRGTPPVAQRVHRTRFARASARYVNWELALAHSPPGGRVEFPIEARWYKPDGSVLAVQTLRTHVEATWADSSHTFGWGSPDPGTWAPGWHRVDFHVGGTVVARASFEILP